MLFIECQSASSTNTFWEISRLKRFVKQKKMSHTEAPFFVTSRAFSKGDLSQLVL